MNPKAEPKEKPEVNANSSASRLVDPGFLSPEKITQIVNKRSDSARLIIERGRLGAYRKRRLINSPLVFPRISDPLKKTRCGFNLSLTSYVLDDHQTLLLYDRSCRPIFEPVARRLAKITALSQRCDDFIKRFRPVEIIFSSCPHNIDTWVFAKTAEFRGVHVRYFQMSMMPWRVFLLQGLNRKPSPVLTSSQNAVNEGHGKHESELISDFIKHKQSSADIALPYYEQERARGHKGKAFRLLSYARQHYNRPDLVFNALQCFRAYRRLSIKKEIDYQYVVFFLHYQPERTTLPEGFGFAQQIFAIDALSSALPADVCLLVKEHPSTFRRTCHWAERGPWFYETLVREMGAHLVPMETDSYTLIDNALAVGTVTGTVAHEALIRGSKAVIFGMGGYYRWTERDLLFYSSQSELAEFLRASINSPVESVINHAGHRLESIKHMTFSAELSEFSSMRDIERNRRDIRESALLNGIRQALAVEI